MLRKRARERREYLFQRSQQIQDSVVAQKRQALKAAVEAGRPLPKDIANDRELQADFKYDEGDENTIDDEYAQLSGVQDPKVVVTTSRAPSARLAQFAKEMRLLFPNSVRVNRGNAVLASLVDACQRTASTDLVMLHEHRGKPSALTVSHFPHGPTAHFSLHNVTLRHDILHASNQSEAHPRLVFDNFSSALGARVVAVLKHLFPPGPKKDSARVITFANKHDYISVRQHLYVKTKSGIELAEVGPRFEMKLFSLKLGTIDNEHADTEWEHRSFVRTANRRDYL